MTKLEINQIIHGDCVDVMDSMPEECVDLVVTSPPYDCYSDDTEILTFDGWKYIKDVQVDEKVMTLNPDTKEVYWENVINTFSYDYDGSLFHFCNFNTDILVTPNHNMYVEYRDGSPSRERRPFVSKSELNSSFLKEAKDVKTSDLLRMNGFKWNGQSKKKFILPSVKSVYNKQERVFPPIEIDMQIWCQFMGIYLSEGSARGTKGGKKKSYEISIKQNKGSGEAYIESILRKMPFEYNKYSDGLNKVQFSISNIVLHTYLKKFGNSREKYIPKEIKELSTDMLSKFLEAYLIGDRTKSVVKRGDLGNFHGVRTFSNRIKDDILEISLKLGVVSRLTKNNFVSFHNRKYSKIGQFKKEVYYKGKVVCVQVEKNNIVFVRRNGKCSFSGNSLRDYKGYKFDIEKIIAGLYKVMKPGGVVVWVVGDSVQKGSETGTSFKQALAFMEGGFNLHDTMIFEKNTSSFPARRNGNRYTQIFEYMFVFSKGKPKTANLICDKKNKWAGHTNWGEKTDRQKDGSLKKKADFKPVPKTSPRNNIWRYVVGGGFGQSDKEAYKHPACVDTLTECLTINGWKNYKTLRAGDLIASYNISYNCLEWKPVTSVHSYNHKGKAIRIEGRRLSILMNEKHRNVAKRGYNYDYEVIPARELKQTHMLKCSAPLKQNKKYVDKNFASLLGWFIAEGWYKYDRKGNVYAACISQSSVNSSYVNQIRKDCSMIKDADMVEYSRCRQYKDKEYTEYCFNLRKDIKDRICDICGKEKSIPSDILSWNIDSLKEFFFSAIKGDGHFREKSKSFSFKQKNIGALHTMQAIGCILGYDTYMSEKNQYVEFINQDHKLLRNSNGSIIENIEYAGVMWCPEVKDNATFVARRKGKTYITGNTFPEQLVEDHVKTWTDKGDVVFDPMVGSGTTCKVAKELGRKYIGVDVSKEYCDLARNRI